jgi:thiosulfate dehydrogenase (quinone) large subunit
VSRKDRQRRQERTARAVDPEVGSSPRERPSGPSVRSAALLPIRFFLGGTFLYAGLDKLVDPAFFDPASPASIQEQLAAFTRLSPIGGIVRIGEPFAVPLGLLIAVAEIAIGLGALSGLAFRLAAAGGAALGLLFWLTASWAIHPYYYGPDLPYAAGWLTLALAGHGDLLVPRRFRAGTRPAVPWRGPSAASRRPRDAEPPFLSRRALLQAGVLAIGAVAVASLAVPLRLLGHEPTVRPVGSGGPGPTTPSGGPSPAPTTAPTPTSAGSSPAGSLTVARVADVARAGAVAFTVPLSAPAPFPAGDPAVVVKLADGSFVAFDAVCTHAGCTVEWDGPDAVLYCPCHGAAFDPAHGAAVLQGPTNQPLASLPIIVDQATGTIRLRA